MSERNKPHQGRDLSGNYKVKRKDVEDELTNPDGEDNIEDDVRLGGAVEDVGPRAGQHGERIERLVEENRANTQKFADQERD